MAAAFEVVGAGAVATALIAEGAQAGKAAAEIAAGHAEAIADDWDGVLRRGRSDYTASRTNIDHVQNISRGEVGAEVYNNFFIARLLNNGTAHHGPKVDLLGDAEPHITEFVRDLTDAVGD